MKIIYVGDNSWMNGKERWLQQVYCLVSKSPKFFSLICSGYTIRHYPFLLLHFHKSSRDTQSSTPFPAIICLQPPALLCHQPPHPPPKKKCKKCHLKENYFTLFVGSSDFCIFLKQKLYIFDFSLISLIFRLCPFLESITTASRSRLSLQHGREWGRHGSIWYPTVDLIVAYLAVPRQIVS